MEQELDTLLNQLIDRRYNLMTRAYKQRIEKAKDKEFAITQYVKRAMAYTKFRLEVNDDYRTLIEYLEEDYMLGEPILYSINNLRRRQKKLEQNEYKSEIFSVDENGVKAELPDEEKQLGWYKDMDNFTDEELVRLYSEYKVYEKFSYFLREEAKPYLVPKVDNVDVTTESEVEGTNEKNKEYTTARQVLAIHFLLKHLQVKNIDMTAKARFIQFLTGKNFDNIYKRVKSPMDGKDSYIKEDLKFVHGYFDKLGLLEVAKMISNEIDELNKKELISINRHHKI